jgi:hypothetical protein
MENSRLTAEDSRKAVMHRPDGSKSDRQANKIMEDLKMLDKNLIEIKTGDIVKIEGSYFKNDNGLYFVENVPGNVTWCGNDVSLKKIKKNGELSIAKSSVAFWPLFICTSNPTKNAAAHEWNPEHATIEIIHGITTEHIQSHFEEEAEQTQKYADREKWNFGENSEYYKKQLEMVAHYNNVVDYLKAKEAPEQITEAQPEVIEAIEETPEQPEGETKPETAEELPSIERIYFSINETLARQSLGMWSFSDYKANSTTNSYKAEVNRVYDIVEQISTKKPHRLADALIVAERYSRKYAEWINKSNHIEMMCPSVMICGAGNFPTRRKEKQNSARDSHMKELDYINGYVKKLHDILTGKEIIKSADADAIRKLQEKLVELEAYQQTMKDANAYYKKNSTLQGFQGLQQKTIDSIMDFMSRNTYHTRPFEGYSLTNNNAKIKATKDRIEQLQKAKTAGTNETVQSDICKVVENSEIMRIQLIFDGKPSEQIRNILKSNGFVWAPSHGAWQRQMTSNGRYATKQVLEQLKKIA